ncbi:uncharacterized protein LOC115545753 isoform X2 [Gadus morhua]|uniref:uncharacterized protein LOC115545753 isoform X2 n=1 Tax=Gadus morhua TaxID=8049 RepID=UPI0011B7B004|nr:uncharacterized protein LOC115545753 isoform X2 [Gadus morhua]
MPQTKSMDTIQQQTLQIVLCLFQEDLGCIEVDGVGDGDKFDPVPIANKLKEVADQLQKQWDKDIPAALLRDANQDISSAFSSAVDSICLSPGVCEGLPEMKLLAVAVALGLYLKTHAPGNVSNIQQATASFLRSRVEPFVDQQGGWGAVADL